MAADDAGVGLEFEATDKNISNYAFTGGALKQVNQLSEAGGVNAFIDDEVLVVKDINKPRKNHSRLLTKDTGMIGIPEITEQGWFTGGIVTPCHEKARTKYRWHDARSCY